MAQQSADPADATTTTDTGGDPAPTVCMVIVTWNRLPQLRRLLGAVAAMERRPDHIVVVDNASADGTPDFLAALTGTDPDAWDHRVLADLAPVAPLVQHIRCPSNEGFAVGLNQGIRVAQSRGDTYAWLSDDDSVPGPDALSTLLEMAAAVPKVGVIGDRGCVNVRGIPRELSLVADDTMAPRQVLPGLYRADWTLVDGALVSIAAVDDVGELRNDFFMMCEDMEFTSRLRLAGYGVVARLGSPTARDHSGAEHTNKGGAHAWRAYYQARNQLLVARSHRSPSEVLAWANRQARLIVAALMARQLSLVKMRLLGAAHGVLGLTGKRVEPPLVSSGRDAASPPRPTAGRRTSRSVKPVQFAALSLTRFARAVNALGWRRGTVLFALDLAPGIRRRPVRWPGLRHPVSLRLGRRESDLATAIQVIHDAEYEMDLDGPVRTVIDAGANIGLAAVWFAHRFPDARIVALEPDPGNFAVLTANVAPFPQIEARREALWSVDTRLDLLDPGSGSWSLRVQESSNGADDGLVPAVSMPTLLRDTGIERVDLLKVDIEGAEVEVFEHPEDWIDRINAVAIELHDRFRDGCSRTFFRATTDFGVDRHRGENSFVLRTPKG